MKPVQRRYPRNQEQMGRRTATWHPADGSIPGFWSIDDDGMPLVLTAAAFAAEWEVCK